MRTNADLTLYRKSVDPTTRSEVWTRSTILSVLWEDRKASNVLASGLLEADSVSVYVPFARGNLTFKNGDKMVRGIVADEIGANFSISDLEAKYPNVVTIHSVDAMDTGSLVIRHWQIGAG